MVVFSPLITPQVKAITDLMKLRMDTDNIIHDLVRAFLNDFAEDVYYLMYLRVVQEESSKFFDNGFYKSLTKNSH